MNRFSPLFFILVLSSLTQSIQAGKTPLSINPIPVNSNHLSLTAQSTGTVEYLIQDQVGHGTRRWSWIKTNNFSSRTTATHSPDCGSESFILSPHEFCYFAISINGAELAQSYQGKPIVGGPIFSLTSTAAYGPSPENQLHLELSSAPLFTSVAIATGTYTDGTTFRPLLALSHNTGTDWFYPSSIPEVIFTPGNITYPGSTYGDLQGGSCYDNICIAAGTYDSGNPATANMPLLALSQNYGASWQYPASIPSVTFTPDNISHPFNNNGQIYSTSCYGSTCIAVGYYYENTPSIGIYQRPLLAVSRDKGTTWSYPSSINEMNFIPGNPHPFNDSAAFLGASCYGNTCIAVGQYYEAGGVGRPMIAVSQDAGLNWAYPASITNPTFSPDNATHPFKNGQLSGASCYATTCIATGSYVDTHNNPYPLVALSQDSGATWSFPSQVNTSAPLSSGFEGANCYENTCVASGLIFVAGFSPLIAVSQDAGSTWTYPPSISTPVLTSHPYSGFGVLHKSSCFSNTCIAGGHYTDNMGVVRPLIALSQDRGLTWSYPDSITNVTFTPDNLTSTFSGNGDFNAVSCNQNICLAFGAYYDGTYTRPMIAQSTDAGTTWTFPSSINAVQFTNETTIHPFVDGGSFYSGSSGTNLWLSQSLKFIASGDPLPSRDKKR